MSRCFYTAGGRGLDYVYLWLGVWFNIDDKKERMRFRSLSSFLHRNNTRLFLLACPDIISMEDLGMLAHFDKY
jgi:hypothetical protein